jgi:hypothetical protein
VKSKSDFVLAKTRHGCFGTTESWTWSDDLSSASQKLTCSKCGYSETFNAEVASSTAPATCTAAGSKTATATVTYNSNWFYAGQVSQDTDTKTSVLPATGHTPVEIPAVPCTETTVGWTAGSKCSVCGEILTAPQKVLIPVAKSVYKASVSLSAGDAGTGSYIYAEEFLETPSDFPNAKITSMCDKASGAEKSIASDSTSGLFSSIGLTDNSGCVFCLPRRACQTGSETYIITVQLDDIHSPVTSELTLDTHSWETDYTIDKAPTETETGEKSIHCSKCDATKDAQTIPAAVKLSTVSLRTCDGGFSYAIVPGTYRSASLFLIAEYGADGRMLDIRSFSVDLGNSDALTGEFSAANDGAAYKAFLLDASRAPIADGVSPASP